MECKTPADGILTGYINVDLYYVSVCANSNFFSHIGVYTHTQTQTHLPAISVARESLRFWSEILQYCNIILFVTPLRLMGPLYIFGVFFSGVFFFGW